MVRPCPRGERAERLPLECVRVLDLAGPIGAYCSKLLADLGADVILMEPPDGDALRQKPPLRDGASGRKASLVFAAYHANKRGVTLDVTRPSALSLLQELGRCSDVILISPSARRPVVGCDREERCLSWAHPDAIVAAITPFGLTGPMRDVRVTPFLSYAMGGGMHRVGESAGPPLGVPGQLQWDEAGIHAALGIVAALAARAQAGGQLLDLSVHEVAAAKDFLLERYDAEGDGDWGRTVGVGIPPTGSWMCADGVLDVAVHQRHHWEAFLSTLDHPDELSEPLLADPLIRRELFEALREMIARIMVGRRRMEVFERGQALGLPCSPRNTPGEFVHDVQPRFREEFATSVYDGQQVTFPWRWFASTTKMLELRRGAPGLGQHNVSIYVDELGFDADVLAAWKEAGVV